jgi:acetylornithine deacetylase
MNTAIDRNYLIKILSDLIRINSINPNLSPEGKGEAEIGAYVANILDSIGLDVKIYEIKPDRVNVIGTLKGTGNGHSLILNAHMDTVGVNGMVIDPFNPVIKDGRLYGRGAQDMKGSLAAMIAAVKALVDSGTNLAGDLYVAAVADEEYISIGTEELIQQVNADAAIVTEPTNLTIGRAHRGFIWYDVETKGRAAHGSRYQEGVDANMRMGRFLAKLDELEVELRHRTPHPLVGPPSLHAARLQGGTEISIYAADCLLQIERRTIPGESETQVTGELQEIIDRLASQDPTFNAMVKPTFQREPFEISPDAPIVLALEKAITQRTGQFPTHTGQSFWTDAALFAGVGIDTILYGPRGHGLHSEEEWVDIDSVLDLAYILADTALDYCQ